MASMCFGLLGDVYLDSGWCMAEKHFIRVLAQDYEINGRYDDAFRLTRKLLNSFEESAVLHQHVLDSLCILYKSAKCIDLSNDDPSTNAVWKKLFTEFPIPIVDWTSMIVETIYSERQAELKHSSWAPLVDSAVAYMSRFNEGRTIFEKESFVTCLIGGKTLFSKLTTKCYKFIEMDCYIKKKIFFC